MQKNSRNMFRMISTDRLQGHDVRLDGNVLPVAMVGGGVGGGQVEAAGDQLDSSVEVS
jgi:uncharacterized spore protein YtfJ